VNVKLLVNQRAKLLAQLVTKDAKELRKKVNNFAGAANAALVFC